MTAVTGPIQLFNAPTSGDIRHHTEDITMDEDFKKQVYEVTRLIPKGRVSTYGAIAKALGYPNHSRHVGKAMGGCPKDVPAHRVVSSGGLLSVPEFQSKLEAEGITVKGSRIKDFKRIFWNPMEELIDE